MTDKKKFLKKSPQIAETRAPMCMPDPTQTQPKVGLGETPRRLSRKNCQYSSLNKSEDAFDTALHLQTTLDRLPLFLRTFVQYLIALWNRHEPASSVISGTFVGPIVPDKPVKFRDPCLNHSREILPEAVGGGIFQFFAP